METQRELRIVKSDRDEMEERSLKESQPYRIKIESIKRGI